MIGGAGTYADRSYTDLIPDNAKILTNEPGYNEDAESTFSNARGTREE